MDPPHRGMHFSSCIGAAGRSGVVACELPAQLPPELKISTHECDFQDIHLRLACPNSKSESRRFEIAECRWPEALRDYFMTF